MSAVDADGWIIAIRYTSQAAGHVCGWCGREQQPAMNARRLIGHLCGSADPTLNLDQRRRRVHRGE